MKCSTLVVSSLLLLVSCGKKTVNKYVENPYDNSANEAKFRELEQRISALESSISSNISLMEQNNTIIQQLQSQLESDVVSLESELSDIEEEVQQLGLSQNNLQQLITTLQQQVAQLETNESVSEVIDPCPTVNSPTYREVLFKMKSGKYVTFFESGGTRFLTVLRPGSYITTDSRACRFSIDANNVLR